MSSLNLHKTQKPGRFRHLALGVAWLLILSLLLSPPVVHSQQFQVTGFSDFAFGTSWSSAPTSEATMQDTSICVYKSGGSNSDYSVVGSGTGSSGQFFMQRVGGGNQVRYRPLWWTSQTAWFDMNANSSRFINNAANTTSSNCGGSPNARIEIRIQKADITNAGNGTYSGTLTVVVGP